jgi:hypothetical protein
MAIKLGGGPSRRRGIVEANRLAIQPFESDDPDIKQMRQQRALEREFHRSRQAKLRKSGGTGGGDFTAAMPRLYDPEEYWKLSGVPWDINDDSHRRKLYRWLRLFYSTHHLIPILIDIFTRFPLVGIELQSKDQKITDFYTDLFMDKLDYDDFLVRLGREYWITGEAFPQGSFNEDLGIWERENIIPTESVTVKQFPLLGTTQFEIDPPDWMRRLVQDRQPLREWNLFQENFADLIPFCRQNKPIPVSDVLMRQVAFRVNDWDEHGTPILLRGLRTLMHEEKLLSSQDAIAERLYSPLILAQLGAQDIGDGTPWIPSPDQLDDLRDDLDIALASDMRLLVQSHALNITSVFGREQMPRLDADFDRVDQRIFQMFGINPSLLSGGSNSQPYASSALQAEFLNQILRTFQGYLKKHFRERALVVAEANEFYDYEKKGGKRIHLMEERLFRDEDTGELYKKKVPKLLVPDMSMKVLDLRDEATQRTFLAQLKGSGVPISDETFMVGMPINFEDELEKSQTEIIMKTVAEAEAKVKAYRILQFKGLPIPQDLRSEVEASGAVGTGAIDPSTGMPMGGPDMGGGLDVGVDVPGAGEQLLPPSEPMGGPMGGPVPGGPAVAGPNLGPPPSNMPEISRERLPIAPASVQTKHGRAVLLDSPLNEDEIRIVSRLNAAKKKLKISLVDFDRVDTPSDEDVSLGESKSE